MSDKQIRIQTDTGNSEAEVKSLVREIVGLKNETGNLNTALKENTKALAGVATGMDNLKKKTEGSERAYQAAGRSVIGFDQQMTSLNATLRNYAALLVSGIGTAELVKGYREGEEAARRLEQVLKTTGYAASLSQSQIAAWADSLENKTGRSATEIQQAAAQLATFTSVGRNEFLKTIEVADDLAAVFGGSLTSNLDAVARALDDPIKGFGNLQKRGFALTESELQRVKAHMKAGESAKAQAIILENLSKQVSGAAEATNQGLTKALNDLKKAAGDAFKAVADAGGVDAAVAALNAATGTVKALQANLGPLSSAFKALAAGVLAYHGANMIAGIGATKLASDLMKARTAAQALNIALAANPAMWVALAIAAGVMAISELDRRMVEAARDTQELTRQQTALENATNAYAIAAGEAAAATGKEAKEKKEAAARTRESAIASRDAAKAKLSEAEATMALLIAEDMRRIESDRYQVRGDRPGTMPRNGTRIRAYEKDITALRDIISSANKSIADADAILKGGGSTDLEYDDSGDKKKGAQAAREAEQRRRVVEDMATAVKLEEARLLGQLDIVQALEREEAIRSRARQLMDAGIEKDRTKAMAESLRMQERIDAARAKAVAKQEDEAVSAWNAELYRIDARSDLVRSLEREALYQERIAKWQALGRDEVTAASIATSEMAMWDQAQAEAKERKTKAAERAQQIEVAELDQNYEMVRLLELQEATEERKTFWLDLGYTLTEATAKATADVLALDQARTREAQRYLGVAQQEHAIKLLDLQGQERALRIEQRKAEITRRSENYQSKGRMKPEDATALATQEVDREAKAKQRGEYRTMFQTAFSDGIRAAMEGDLQGFLEGMFNQILDVAMQNVAGALFDMMFGTVQAAATGTAEGTAHAAIVAPAIVSAATMGGTAMSIAITTAGTIAANAMFLAITTANMAGSIGLPGFKDGGPIHLAGGGAVHGPGGPRTDSIPAMLSDGEFVINANATKKNRALLEAINNGKVGHFANGGLVGQISNSKVRGRSLVGGRASNASNTYGGDTYAPQYTINANGKDAEQIGAMAVREFDRYVAKKSRKIKNERPR